MFLDKLEERHEVNRKALETALSALLSMVGSNAGNAGVSGNARHAINAIMKYYGHEEDHVESDINSVEDVENYLRLHGMMCSTIELKGKWWKKCGGPLLTKNDSGEVISLVPKAFGYEILSGGEFVRFKPSMDGHLSRKALQFFRSMPAARMTKKDFFKYCRESIPTWDFVIVIVFCVVATLLSLLVPVANKILFNDVIPSGIARGILPLCGLLFASSISAILFELCRNLTLDRVKDRLNANVQPALMARLLYLPSSFFKKYSSGDLGMRVLAANSIYQLMTSEILAVFATAVFSLMYIVIVFVYAKQMILVVTLLLVLSAVLIFLNFKICRKEYGSKIPVGLKAQDFSYNALLGVQKIKNNRAELRAFAQWASRYSQSEIVLKWNKLLGALFTTASTFFVYFVALRSGMALSDYVAFMSAFGMMVAAINEANMTVGTLASVSPYASLLEPILEAEPELRHNVPIVDNISGSIDISHVSFSYGPDSPKVLDDVSIHIRPGEYIGLVGSSGCGKSTLMRLMLGFEKPQQGSIFYGQYNVDNVNLGSLRQFVGFCPQSMQIFPGTIADNIRFGCVSCTDGQIWEAARIAAIDQDIEKMPLGMDTMLGEGGSGLSGGQCQRLLIARAVISHPRVLFLDEATSALDNITQRKVVDNLNAFGCTRIAIAHRLSTIMHCDRIIVLDKGHIVEEGSPDDLIRNKGFFYNLSQRQQ